MDSDYIKNEGSLYEEICKKYKAIDSECIKINHIDINQRSKEFDNVF